MSNFSKLKNAVDKGHLLHGSRHKFKTIKPNKRKKIDSRAGRIKAVYATNDPLLAIFLAILDPSKLPLINKVHKSLVGWTYDSNDNLKTAITPNFFKHKAFGCGYVYVVKKNTFKLLKKLPHEYYSYKSIQPTKIIKVLPKDFHSLINPEVYPVEAVRKANFHTEEEIELMGY